MKQRLIEMKLVLLRLFLSSILLLNSDIGRAQNAIISQLQLTETVPNELLATRSVAIYHQHYKKSELEQIQKMFAQIGIDAEFYLEEDLVLAGKDITQAYTNYFIQRDIKNLILLDKSDNSYRMITTAFNNKISLVDADQGAWVVTHSNLQELLLTAYRNAWISQKKQNFLVNEVPETNPKVSVLGGKRSEFFAIDLKVDELAVPYYNNAAKDTALVRLMKETYPYKYRMVQPAIDDMEHRKKGSLYVLCMIQARGKTIKQLLGYDMTKAESAYTSATFPNGLPQMKTIPSETEVYKFYVKHINTGNVFLGTKWDADTTPDQALKNYIKGFRAELKLD